MFLTKERLRLYLGGLLVLQLFSAAALLPIARAGKVDFRTFYTAGFMLRHAQPIFNGEALYDYEAERAAQSAVVSPNLYALPFMSPPFAALLFVPFALGTYQAGYFLFFAFNLLACGLAVVILRPYLPSLDARWRPLTALLFLSFMPLGIALLFGQVSILLLLLYCACFAALKNGRPALAGVLLSLALIKFQIALPVALLFLIWRQWRFTAGFLCGALGLALVSLRIAGPKVLEAYLHSLLFMSRASSSAAGEARYAMFPFQMPNLYGFFHSIFQGATWGTSSGAWWTLALTLLCSLLVLLWAAVQRPSLPLALLAGMLVSYHLYLYDLTLLLLPISLVFNQNLASPLRGRGRGAFYAAAFFILASLWGALLALDDHFLFAIPVAVLFACLDPASIDSPAAESPALA